MRKKISFLILTILAVGSLYFLAFPDGDKAFATIQSNSVIKIDENTTNGPTTIGDEDYGQSVENIGDLDGDGIDDIAVGVILDDNGDILTENYGAIFIHFMNTNGTIDSSVKIDSTTPNGPPLDYNDYRYGSSIESIGDLNGDGVPDIAVGAVSYFGDASNTGAVFIHFMNTDGSIDSTVTLDRSTTNGAVTTINPGGGGDYYGHGIANLGDLNGDGVIDLAVGSPLESQNGSARGAVFIHFMNTDGSIDSTVKINDATANGPSIVNTETYGYSVANIGDLNDDGVIDLAVGSAFNAAGGTNRGAVFIHFMNTDGSVDSTVELNTNTTNGAVLANFDRYGSSVEGLGDLNGDGVEDLAVGVPFSGIFNNTDEGIVYVHYLNTDGSIDSSDTITPNVRSSSSLYGESISLLQDYSGDGTIDLAVGAPGENAFFIHFIELIPEVTKTNPISLIEGGGSASVSFSIGFLEPTDDVTVTISYDSDQVTADETEMVFTSFNWDTPQTFNVTAVDDALEEGNHSSNISYTFTSNDPVYNGFVTVATSANITDNDVPPGLNAIISTDHGTEYDVTEDFIENTIELTLTSENTEDVVVTMTPDDQLDIEFFGAGVPYEVTFLAGTWDTPQYVFIYANDDLDIEGLHNGIISYALSSIDLNYDGLVGDSTTVRIRDNDVGMVLSESGGSTSVTEGGATDTFTISLGSEPTDDVVVTITPDSELSLSSSVLTFTSLDWFTPQTVTVTAVNDTDIEGAHSGLLTFGVTSFDVNYEAYVLNDITASITDNDPEPEPEPDPEPQASGSSSSSGFIMPHIRFKDKIKDTDSRFVDLEAFAPYTITYFEISNTPDFAVKETYQREYTQKDLYWDLCKGLSSCVSGEKFVYARFYSDVVGVREGVISINYNPKLECPYFKGFLRKGSKTNDPLEVKKAQEFLNRELSINLDIDGIFGKYTDRAVRDFQEKYPQEILFPWQGLTKSTGWWYITTSRYANVLMGCK